MDKSWEFILELVLLAIYMGMASFLKKRLSFVRKFLIPTPIVAGFLGLLLGSEVLGIIPLNQEILGELVYHLMAIGFIALSLQKREGEANKEVVKAGAYIVSTYLVQGIIGFSLSLFLAHTFYPDLFPIFGLLLPLAYGQGPGQAYSIGSQWEKIGFYQGGNIGLTLATFGFVWASLAGLLFLNYLVRKKKFKLTSKTEHHSYKIIPQKMEYRESTSNESLDSFTTQLFLIGAVYFLTFITLITANQLLLPLGTLGATLAQLLWGFHFIIGSLFGILIRFLINRAKRKGYKLYFDTDKFLLQRITGGAFDFMITASIAAISIYTLREYLVPILLLSTVGGILTMIYTYYMVQRVFKNHHLENILGFYGMQTGTISTGMALLKEVDPNLTTNATDNLVMGSATAIFFGFPLMLLLSLPVIGYSTNQPQIYFYSLLAFIVYLLILYLIIFRFAKKDK